MLSIPASPAHQATLPGSTARRTPPVPTASASSQTPRSSPPRWVSLVRHAVADGTSCVALLWPVPAAPSERWPLLRLMAPSDSRVMLHPAPSAPPVCRQTPPVGLPSMGGVSARGVSPAPLLPPAPYRPLLPLASLYASVFFTAVPLRWCLRLAGTPGALLPGRYVRIRRRSRTPLFQPLLPRTLFSPLGVHVPNCHHLVPRCHSGHPLLLAVFPPPLDPSCPVARPLLHASPTPVLDHLFSCRPRGLPRLQHVAHVLPSSLYLLCAWCCMVSPTR